MVEDPLITTIHLPWFFMHVILIPLKMHIGMNGLPFFMICILVQYNYNWDNLWMIQSTNRINSNCFYLILIDASNVEMPVWGSIDDSNILTRNPPIIIPVNQLLTVFVVVVVHVYKWYVNLMVQFSINNYLFHILYRRWVGAREYLPYICREILLPHLDVHVQFSFLGRFGLL